MPGLILAFLTALALSLLLTPAAGWLACRWGFIDHPAPRKVHASPTPLLGGVAVLFAFAAATMLFLRPVALQQMILLLAGAAAFGAIGLVDDLRNVGAVKLAAEAAVVVALVWLGGIKVDLPWPHMGEVLAVLWIVGVANAWNCLDCTDGVAGGTAVIGALALIPLAMFADRLGVAVTAAAAAGAALGFLRYNFPPARIFAGDGGSLMLGFLLAALGAALAVPQATPVQWAAPVLVLALPCCDFLFVHVRRYRSGVRNPLTIMTSTGKDHLPHRLLDAGLSHRQVAFTIYAASAVLAASAIELVIWGPVAAAALLTIPALILPAAGWSTGGSRKDPGKAD